MLIGSLIGWIFAGLIVGALARLLVPGRQNIGVVLTIVLGIVGALVGGFFYSLAFGQRLVTDGSQAYAVESAWPGWIVATLGGALVLWVVLSLFGGKSTNRLS